MTLELLTALGIGFAGASHCIGMCGGISAAFSLGTEYSQTRSWQYSLMFNFGRLITYTLLGALIGGIASLIQLNQYLQESLFLAGTMLILMGLSVGRWWQGVRRIEALGTYIWQWLQPIRRYLMPIRSFPQALGLGMVWGWLPCGLIYSSLIWAASTASWYQSALLMLAFGIGTLPANLASGILAQQLKALLRQRLSQNLLGLSMILLGIYTLPLH